MLYVLVDPFLLYLPRAEKISKQQAKSYMERLIVWTEIVEKYPIELRLSAACEAALQASSGYPINDTELGRIIAYHKLGDEIAMAEDFVTSCMRFFNDLMKAPKIDAEVGKSQTNQLLWEIIPEDIDITPQHYVERVEDERLRRAFKLMLAEVGFARVNKIVPISTLENVWLASAPLSENASKSESPQRIRVCANCVVEKDFPIDQPEAIEDAIPVAHASSDLDGITVELPAFRSVYEAAHAAAEKYKSSLVFTNKAQDTARNYEYEDPMEIYRLLEGLVTVWLPAYRNGGNDKANGAYHDKFGRMCARDESDTARRKYPEDYTVDFEGRSEFCGRHIKIGSGPNCPRINFQVVDSSDGVKRIVLARVGRHGRNTRS